MTTIKNNKGPNYSIAIGLIVIGFLFLLDNFDIIDIGDLWQFWPLILIFMGIIRLKRVERYTNEATGERVKICGCSGPCLHHHDKVSGIFLILIGGVFLLMSFDILYWDDVWQFWPLILICIGISIIFKYYRTDSQHPDMRNAYTENKIDLVSIFSGNKKIVTADKFQGGTITTIFAGTEVDLSHAKLSSGANVIDIFTIFGGTEIYVPSEWNVIIKGLPIFGGFEDTRRKITAEDRPNDQTLILKGLVLFGGLEIKTA